MALDTSRDYGQALGVGLKYKYVQDEKLFDAAGNEVTAEGVPVKSASAAHRAAVAKKESATPELSAQIRAQLDPADAPRVAQGSSAEVLRPIVPDSTKAKNGAGEEQVRTSTPIRNDKARPRLSAGCKAGAAHDRMGRRLHTGAGRRNDSGGTGMSIYKDNAPAVSAAGARETTTGNTAAFCHTSEIAQGEHTVLRGDLPGGRIVELVSGDKVKPQAIEWLWDGYLAAGKLHIVAGAPGTGKTTLAVDLAATLTTGGRWPDGTVAPSGDVIIWSGEDSIDDTLVPRLRAAGADMRRVHFVHGVVVGGTRRPFDPATDFETLAQAAEQLPELRMMLVDPIASAVAADSHKNSETRRALQPLVDFAERIGCALVGVTHFTKGTQGREPLERVTGSLAFGAMPRIVLATAKLKKDGGGGRVLVRAKSNIGPDGGGFRYELPQEELPGEHIGIFASRVRWCGPVDGTAQTILAVADQDTDPDEKSGLQDASDWLRARIEDAGGEMARRELIEDAKEAGFSERTIQRAKKRAGVITRQTGFGAKKQSTWMLAETRIVPIVPDEMVGTDGTNGGPVDAAKGVQ